MSGMTDYLENKLLDFLLRGQAFVPPATLYVALLTGNRTDGAAGTEVSASSYARAPIASSLVNWAGTQASGSTAASSGTSGMTSNNGAITFNAPTDNWGDITGMAVMDAATGGNGWLYAALTVTKTVNASDAAPKFDAGLITIQLDN